MKTRWSLLFVFIVLLGCVENGTTDIQITNFKECIEAENPAMESYPRQCKANEETFVEIITPENYEVAEILDQDCKTHYDCDTPMDYLIRSNCPYTSICLEGKCAVICPIY